MLKTLALAVVALSVTFVSAQDGRPVRDPNRPVSVFVIDMAGNDFQLAAPDDGVRFDIDGTGTPIQIGWTKASVDDAFLFLDTNGNGKVDGGRELIGDGWRLPDGSRVVSGDDALLVIQGRIEPLPLGPVAPENIQYGSVDANDEVFAKLRLWTDANHNGQSESSELQTLTHADVLRISLGFRLHTDRPQVAGNTLLYSGQIYMNPSIGEHSEPGTPPPQYRYPRRMSCIQFGRKTSDLK